ncbi:MAG TPA: lipoyl(octanoyl) transferase LipB [Gammaproteobacteria bacterium]|nr:lipoyl(octanoyl) transferase LipB [Gammaproteobacteria bacterium]
MITRDLGEQALAATWADMRAFTDARGADAPDEIWFVSHPPIFTLGMNADPRHVLAAGDIPVLRIDRGGQVTYHGPGQLVAYTLIDLRRRGLTVRKLVEQLECAVVDTVAAYGVSAYGRCDARGVYVGAAKLAAVGLRVRRHCAYHGIAVNVAMDLEPFRRINPCGYESLEVTQLKDLCAVDSVARVRADLTLALEQRFA